MKRASTYVGKQIKLLWAYIKYNCASILCHCFFLFFVLGTGTLLWELGEVKRLCSLITCSSCFFLFLIFLYLIVIVLMQACIDSALTHTDNNFQQYIIQCNNYKNEHGMLRLLTLNLWLTKKCSNKVKLLLPTGIYLHSIPSWY